MRFYRLHIISLRENMNAGFQMSALVRSYFMSTCLFALGASIALAFPRTDVHGHVPIWTLISNRMADPYAEFGGIPPPTDNCAPPDCYDWSSVPPEPRNILWAVTVPEAIAMGLIFGFCRLAIRCHRQLGAWLLNHGRPALFVAYLLAVAFLLVRVPCIEPLTYYDQELYTHGTHEWEFLWNLGRGAIDYGAFFLGQLSVLALFIASQVVFALVRKSDKGL